MIMGFYSSYAGFYFMVKALVGQMFTRPNFQHFWEASFSFLTVATQKKYIYVYFIQNFIQSWYSLYHFSLRLLIVLTQSVGRKEI